MELVMKKPSSSIVGLLGSEKFRSGQGNSQDLIALLKEQDAVLAGMQAEAEDIVHQDVKWREVVREHWYNLAHLRVNFIGCVDGVTCKWSDGEEWKYPVDTKDSN
jgi:hypothetical protein